MHISPRRYGPLRSAACPLTTAFLAVLIMVAGCSGDGVIEVDFSSQQVRFIIDHRGWPRPLSWPRVNDFGIASEEDGPIWQLQTETLSGLPARQLAIIYGEVPRGFSQVFPSDNAAPKPLERGRNYFVAAGGPKQVYKAVFALPVDAMTPLWNRSSMPSTTTQPEPAASTETRLPQRDGSAPRLSASTTPGGAFGT